MVNQNLTDYIKKHTERGIAREAIKEALLKVGWQESDIEEGFRLALDNPTSRPMNIPSVPSFPSSPEVTQTISIFPGALILLNEAWRIYKSRIKTFLGILLIPLLITLLAFIPIIATLINPNASSSLFLLGISLFFTFLGGVVSIISLIALTYAIKDREENIGIGEAYRRVGLSNFFSYLWISILVTLITLGGFVLLIIPGIIFWVWFSLALFVLIAEDVKGMDALFKSKEYIKGRWLGVFWRILFISLVSFFIFFVFNLTLNLISSFSGKGIGNILQNFISFFITPLVMTYLFLIYSKLKQLKKGEVLTAPTRAKKVGFCVIGILGPLFLIGIIISMVTILSLGRARVKARDARRLFDIRMLESSLEMYYDDNKEHYPSSLNELTPTYFRAIPSDPQTKLPYEYKTLKGGKDFELCANLETEARECTNSSNFEYPLR